MIPPRQRKGEGLKDLARRSRMFVGTVAMKDIGLMSAVQKQRRRKSIFLTWMKKLKVSFFLSLMNYFLNLQVLLKIIAKIKTSTQTMIQNPTNLQKVVLVRRVFVLVGKNLKSKFFQIILRKLSLMSFNTSLRMRLEIVFFYNSKISSSIRTNQKLVQLLNHQV